LQLRGSHMESLPYVCNDHHVPSTPQTPPLTAPWPSHLLYGSSSTLAERPLTASTDNVHRLPPPRISTTTGNCFPRTSTNTSAPAPRVWEVSRRARLQQLRLRPVKIDGGFGRSAHPPPGSGACPCRTVCVYGATGCTAESSRAFGGNAPVLCSTAVDAARNGGSGSQAHSSHV
jgi:hypothetical protein